MKGFVDGLAKNLRIIAPTEREWIESGKIVCYLITERGYDVNKTREIHFDVLIALTARRIGAYLITCNSKDFIAIQRYVRFELICW
jgi:predicted nucleic acid-binding protein